MASFLGGVIPTITAFSNSTANQFVSGVVSGVAETAIQVAINKTVGDEWLQSLGVNPLSVTNIAQNIITPGLLGAGSQLINRAITDGLKSSPALAPLGSLLSGAATGLLNKVGQDLLGLGDLYGSKFDQIRYFPGSGDEPDADYEGFVYNPAGKGSTDVVFSIYTARSRALEDIWTNSPTTFNATFFANEALASADFGFKYEESLTQYDFSSVDNLTGVSFSEVANILPEGADDSFLYNTENVDIGLKPQPTWTFICAPEDVSWDLTAQVDRIQIFGTNTPPVTSGSKGMRDLTLSNALVEGFSRGKSVEEKIAQLEALMNMSITSSSYVSVPVYQVKANDKVYGSGIDDSDGGYFVIRDIKVKEVMRDLTGKTTRATVDISFVQVPKYQVTTGRDTAKKAVTSATSILKKVEDRIERSVQNLVDQGVLSLESQERERAARSGGRTGGGGGAGAGAGAGSGNSQNNQSDVRSADPTDPGTVFPGFADPPKNN